MLYDICCVGHLTLDKVVTPQATVFMAGGTAYYFSCALAGLDLGYLLVTAVADSEMQFVTSLREKGVQVTQLPSAHTVFFENNYDGNPNHRTQRVLQQADPFLPGQLLQVDAQIFHLGALLAADIPAEVIPALAAKAKVSLDVQGFLRRVEGEAVVLTDWAAKKTVLPFVYFLKASEEEAVVLTGCPGVYESAKQLAAWGVKEVIITLGSMGSVVYSNETFYRIPAFAPSRTTDVTGCGDTYMAGYLYRRVKGGQIQEAGEFAAAMATAKIAASGPFTGNEEDVEAIIKMRQLHTD